MDRDKSKYFLSQLSKFENLDIQQFCVICIQDIPDYFFWISASSSGKYHPDPDNLKHGLYFHTIAVSQMLNHMLEPDCIKNLFTSRERDMMRCAALLHDSRKYGNTNSGHTVFEHPALAAAEVFKRANNNIISEDEVEDIAIIISSHMGQWNTSEYYESKLPLPLTRCQKALHLADYLASRADIITKENLFYDVKITPLSMPILDEMAGDET